MYLKLKLVLPKTFKNTFDHFLHDGDELYKLKFVPIFFIVV